MMLRVAGLSFAYKSVSVLEGVNFDIQAHQITAVMGPNGAGKTTLLRCINRILRPQGGTVLLEQQDLGHFSGREIAKQVAYVAQRNEPVRMTAFDAILLGRKPYIGWNVSEKDMRITQAVMRRLDLEDLSLRYIDEMSGGEYQKVCIARAMVQDPQVMLLDEPTNSLDLRNQLSILRLLRVIVRDHHMCAAVSMHDLNTAFRYADKFVFLKDGVVCAATDRPGITEEIVRRVYGVPVLIHWHQDHPVVLPIDENI